MRGLALFVAGALVGGLAVQTAIAQGEHSSPNSGVVGINHVALAVPDIEKAVTFYTKTMGFPEAFRVKNDKGEIQLVYVQVSKGTFIEIQKANEQRPAGIYHFGIHVDNVRQASDMWKARGANVQAINTGSPTKAVLSNIVDPNGVRMELVELPPESLHRQAMDKWH
jgi:catechol 2,3-dioxygenase-like lactoylglutathione lyase family enzyme